MEVYVCVWGHLALDRLLGMSSDFSLPIPTFPLNTDGIDPSGTNILIERVKITNFDDAVAIKPADKDGKMATCSENIIVRDCEVNFGVGMSIGSVAARESYRCVRNVTFSNITFNHPLKALYIKTNPGSTSSMLPGSGGEITNIVYEDIKINFPIWWNIYIGPQQMKEPDGRGPGCMLYPIDPDCATEPLITIANITLRNIESHSGFLPPGIIRCNETNPCTGINFENVQVHGWWSMFRLNFITEYAHGTVTNSKPHPALDGQSSVFTYLRQWFFHALRDIISGDLTAERTFRYYTELFLDNI